MNTQDRIDEQIAARLRADAPREAPGRILDGALDRIADTPQRGSGWSGRTSVRLLAAAAVLLLAVVAGTQLPSLVGRDVGAEISPSVSPSASTSAEPTAAVTPSPSATPSASAAPTEPPVTGDGLLLRLVSHGGGPTYPSQLLPWATLMADGTLVWQPVPAEAEASSLVTRSLTPAGLADLREHIFGGGLLGGSANHELQPQPGAEPPGRGVSAYTFTAAGDGGDDVVVTSVQWLGDEEESTYYQPSPERRQLDALAQQLRDPEALVDADAWTGASHPYAGSDYQLVLTPSPDRPPFDTADASEIPWPFDGALDQFGEATGDSRSPTYRCGVIGTDEAARMVEALTALGYADVGLDRATTGSLDWADGNGTVDFFLMPRMPDGYPECEDQF
ncbi:MAG: hypothetical protein ABR593_00350 [Candidatus Limnocylindria bacterium]